MTESSEALTELKGPPGTGQRRRRRVAAASLIGTAIEYYDFFIYGTATALVFNALFFTPAPTEIAAVLSFAIFASGFLARPLGALLFGHYGDRIGRKSMLIATILIMGFATVAMGLLPTYATVGVWAPVLLVLLRVIQGFAAGGEWGGAALMTVEHAQDHRRGLLGGFTQAAIPIAFILANAAFLPLTVWLTEEQLASWGWRIPFLLSLILVAAGIFLRLGVAESPVFEEVQRSERPHRSPVLEVLRRHWFVVVATAFAVAATSAIGYLKNVYFLSYATQSLGIDQKVVLSAILVNAAIEIFLTLFFAHLSDRIGRRTVFVGGAVFSALWAVPFFLVPEINSFWAVLLALLGTGLGSTAMFGPLAALIAETFTAEIRYTGASVGYQVGSILGGGFAPLIAAGLYALTGNILTVSIYMIALCVLSVVAVVILGETKDNAIRYMTPQETGSQEG